MLVSCSSTKEDNHFERIETGDYPFLPIGTTVDALKSNYDVEIDSIVYDEPPKQTIKASRVLFDSIFTDLYIWMYTGEVIYYSERFDCNNLSVNGIDSVLSSRLYNVSTIDSLLIRGRNTWILKKGGNEMHFTHLEYPNIELGCNECECRVSGGYHVALTEGLIENF